MSSVLDFIRKYDDGNGLLTDSAVKIPGTGNEEGSVYGAYEGILLRSMNDFSLPFYANYVLGSFVKKLIKKYPENTLSDFEKKFIKYTAITVIDPLLSNLHGKTDSEKARGFARMLLEGTENVETVKIAIALLGEYGVSDDLHDLILLGSHEEFTLYSSVAVKNICARENIPSNDIILSLCEKLSGWGKIAGICELDFELKKSRDFVLRSGCRNVIANSYLSNICAIKGKMLSYLKSAHAGEEVFDEGYFNGICDIWDGFCDDSHPENDGFSDYPDGPEALCEFKACVNKYSFGDVLRERYKEERDTGRLPFDILAGID